MADVRLCERRGVVDAVAHHGHHLALALESAHLVGLVLGQNLRQHAIDAHLAGNGLGGAAVVAAEHDHFDAHRLEAGDGLLSALFDRIGHGNQSLNLAVDSHKHRGLGRGLQPGSIILKSMQIQAAGFHH